MKHNHTDEEIQAAVDGACKEIHAKHRLDIGSNLVLDTNAMPGAWESEKHPRLHLLKSALARLPEPQPTTTDGRTPGRLVGFEDLAMKLCAIGWTANNDAQWEGLRDALPELRSMLGGTDLEAQAKLDYRHNMGLRFGMMTSSDKPEPYLAHTWVEDSDHERMFREWTESIGWQESVRKAEANLEQAKAQTEEFKRIGQGFERGAQKHFEQSCLNLQRAEKAEAELANLRDWKVQQLQVESEWDCQMLAKKLGVSIGQSCRAGIQKAILAMLEQPQLSTLRPIAEAGEVPAGAVRVYVEYYGRTLIDAEAEKFRACTHFADILLPEDKAPTVEADPYAELKAAHGAGKVIQWNNGQIWIDHIMPDNWEPIWIHPTKDYRIKPASTFTAHGKTWNVHVPGDPMPCDGGCWIETTNKSGGIMGPCYARRWDWNAVNHVIGWRYADEPIPEPVKEWALPQPPLGKQWHRNDWTKEMLPEGWRPLLAGEPLQAGDWTNIVGEVIGCTGQTPENHLYGRPCFCRTSRPLPETPAEPVKPWAPAVGDVVMLKSGGPKMTVHGSDRDDPADVWCRWFDGNRSRLECFPGATLQPA